jgi:hypothetical protein
MENQEIKKLEQEIGLIKQRNIRVEADKVWETSAFRIVSIMVITYIIASFVLYFIGANNFLLGALVPTVGYFLSTQSLPFIKRWWTNKFIEEKKKA